MPPRTPLSASPILPIVCSALGTFPLALGFNAIFRPRAALSLFQVAAPSSPTDGQLADALITLYGARDIFLGFATYAAAWAARGQDNERARKALGWIQITGAGVVAVDGNVARGLVATTE